MYLIGKIVPQWTNQMLLVEEMRIDVQQAERSPQARSQEITKRLFPNGKSNDFGI